MLPGKRAFGIAGWRHSKTIKLKRRHWTLEISLEPFTHHLAAVWELAWRACDCSDKGQSRINLKRGTEITEQNPNQTKVQLTLRNDESQGQQAWRNLLFNEQKDNGTQGGMLQTQTLENAYVQNENHCLTKLNHLWDFVESRFKQKLNHLPWHYGSRNWLRCTLKNASNHQGQVDS